MQWLQAAWVGVAGGATIEAIDVFKAIRWHHTMPWNVGPDTAPPRRVLHVRPGEAALPAPGPWAYCLAGILRLFVSAAPTAVIAASWPQRMNPLIAYAVGLGALSVVQQLASLAPLIIKNVSQAALNGTASDNEHQPLTHELAHPGPSNNGNPSQPPPDPLPPVVTTTGDHREEGGRP
jgi:hypothetical protein